MFVVSVMLGTLNFIYQLHMTKGKSGLNSENNSLTRFTNRKTQHKIPIIFSQDQLLT